MSIIEYYFIIYLYQTLNLRYNRLILLRLDVHLNVEWRFFFKKKERKTGTPITSKFAKFYVGC